MPQRQYYQNVLQHLASTQEQEVFPTNHHTHTRISTAKWPSRPCLLGQKAERKRTKINTTHNGKKSAHWLQQFWSHTNIHLIFFFLPSLLRLTWGANRTGFRQSSLVDQNICVTLVRFDLPSVLCVPDDSVQDTPLRGGRRLYGTTPHNVWAGP